MLRNTVTSLLMIVAVCACLPAYATTYGVGGCNPKLVNFSSIQSAVNSATAGSTILICPGTYFEQVTIGQPLTLKAATYNNSNRAIIATPAGVAVAPNVTSIDGTSFYAQVLIQDVNPPGPVNIIGITVDGTGVAVDCGLPNGVAGIFYAVNTSGTVNEVTARNQQSCTFSTGIWAENSAGAPQSVIIENSSVRNIDGQAIVTSSDQSPSTLAAIIRGNFVSQTAFSTGIWDFSAGSAISNNFVTGGAYGIANSAAAACCAPTVSGNVVADVAWAGVGTGMDLQSGTAQNNKLSNVYIAFDLFGAASISSNMSMNTTYEVVLNCIPGASVSNNLFNDSQYGFYQSSTLITGNKNFNIDTLQTGTCP
jgi:hypothetical protein